MVIFNSYGNVYQRVEDFKSTQPSCLMLMGRSCGPGSLNHFFRHLFCFLLKSDWFGIGTMEFYIILWLSIGNFMKTQVTNSLHQIFSEGWLKPPTVSVVTSCLIRTCCHRNVYIECINKLSVVEDIEYAQSPTTQTRSWTQAMEPPKNAMAHVRRSFQTKICAWCRLKMEAPYTLRLQQHFEGCVLLRSGIP